MRMLKAEEVADLLRVPRARAYELARQGLLPCVRLGRQVRFDADVVRKWAAQGGRQLPAQENDSNH